MRIGEALVKDGLISKKDLKVALTEQKRTSDRLGDIILKMGLVTSDQIAPFLARYFNISYIDLKSIYKDLKPEVIDCISVDIAERFNAIPIALKEGTLTIAMIDPLDLLAIDTFRIKTGYKIKCVVAPEADVAESIEYCYYNMPRLKQHVDDFVGVEMEMDDSPVHELEKSSFAASDQPVVQYVKSLIVQAINSGSSDVHLQPKQDKADLRFRIDGVLYKIDPPPLAMVGAINTRIKILAGLDIAEKRLPQDGRFKVKIGKSEVDIRTSSFPTIYGESLVMRLLDTSAPLLGLEQLGFYQEDLVHYRKMINPSLTKASPILIDFASLCLEFGRFLRIGCFLSYSL